MIKVTRWLDSNKIRQMCVRYRYYTCGDCESYNKMLDRAVGLNADDLNAVLTIAKDIYEHSTVRNDLEYPKRYCLEGLVNMLLLECVDLFVELDDDELEETDFPYNGFQDYDEWEEAEYIRDGYGEEDDE